MKVGLLIEAVLNGEDPKLLIESEEDFTFTSVVSLDSSKFADLLYKIEYDERDYDPREDLFLVTRNEDGEFLGWLQMMNSSRQDKVIYSARNLEGKCLKHKTKTLEDGAIFLSKVWDKNNKYKI